MSGSPLSPRVQGWLQWLRLGLGSAGFAGLLCLLLLLVSRHNWRLDLTPDKRFSLSPRAAQVLRGLAQDVRVVAFVRADDARNREVEDLLRRAAKESPRLQYEIVDLNRNPALARQYGVGAFASFVVESRGLRRGFTNAREESLIEALLQVTGQVRRIAYFTSGHGEGDLRSNDRRNGYSDLVAALRAELFEWRPLDLSAGSVPADAGALVVLGSHDDWPLSDLLVLRGYLESGGAVLMLLDPGPLPSMGGFLASYGIQLNDDVVVDRQSRLFAGDRMTFVASAASESAPIAKGLKSPPLLSGVRQVSFAAPRARAASGEEALHAAASATLERPDASDASDSARSGHGPIALAVSVEVAVAAERTARIVAIGDSDFVGNSLLEYLGNKDLLLNSLNWLSGSAELNGERAQRQVAGVNQLFVTEEQGQRLFVLAAIVEPGLFLALGVAVYLWRRWV